MEWSGARYVWCIADHERFGFARCLILHGARPNAGSRVELQNRHVALGDAIDRERYRVLLALQYLGSDGWLTRDLRLTKWSLSGWPVHRDV